MVRIGRGNWNVDKVILGSFSKNGTHIPTGHYTIDLSGFRDPGGAKAGTFPKHVVDGTALELRTWIASDPRVQVVIDQIDALVHTHLEVGKEAFLEISMVDPQGVWIGPAVVELVADHLTAAKWSVATKHYALGGGAA